MHPNEIPKPTEIEWQPVIVTFPDGRVHRICGPLEAFEVLACGPADSLCLNARLCCRLALERKMSVDEARLAFIAATAERIQGVV
jgi:hypothetical protein